MHPDDHREVLMTGRIVLVVGVTLMCALSLLALGGCSGGARKPAQGGSAKAAAGGDSFAQGTADGGAATASQPAAPKGPAIVVTWEALAREKYLLENSRFRRRGPQPPQKITLISSSHPDAAAYAAGRSRRNDATASTAILDDKDIVLFVKGLERSGFFKYARPAGYDTATAQSDNARGRVTVTRGGDSRTLLSIRGQGLNDRTKAIPALYSEAKQAIIVLRNMTPTLSVSRSGASGTAPTR